MTIVTVMSVIAGIMAMEHRVVRQSIDSVHSFGGTAYFRSECDKDSLPYEHSDPEGVGTLRGWLGRRFGYDWVDDVVTVDVRNTRATDEDIETLLAFPSLRRLAFANSAVTDKSIPLIIKMKELRWLDAGDSLSQEGLKRLAAARPDIIVELGFESLVKEIDGLVHRSGPK